MADFNKLVFRVNDPGNLRPTAKKVFQSFLYLPGSVRPRDYLDHQVGRSGEKTATFWPKAELIQPRSRDEGNVWCPTIPVLHPASQARSQNHTELVRNGITIQSTREPHTNLFVVKV